MRTLFLVIALLLAVGCDDDPVSPGDVPVLHGTYILNIAALPSSQQAEQRVSLGDQAIFRDSAGVSVVELPYFVFTPNYTYDMLPNGGTSVVIRYFRFIQHQSGTPYVCDTITLTTAHREINIHGVFQRATEEWAGYDWKLTWTDSNNGYVIDSQPAKLDEVEQ